MGFTAGETIVATGHQAAVWHPGILAKDIAVSACVRDGTNQGRPTRSLHFIADHDANDGGLVTYPTLELTRGSWRMFPAADGHAMGDRPASRPSPPPSDAFRHPGLREGLEAIHETVNEHADAENLAGQIARSTSVLATPFTGDVPRHSMSRLLQMPVGLDLLDRISRDSESCLIAHDAAIEAERLTRTRGDGRLPRGVARLLRRGGDDELPLWRMTSEGRRPVLRGEKIDPAQCRPRALLATALARIAGCDLFVHGTGGGIYDRAMESWIEGWLGIDALAELAPATVASATLRLPLDHGTPSAPLETPEGLHRLRSNPDLGRTDPPRRNALLASIEAASRGSSQRRSAFLALRHEIELARDRGHGEIERYRRGLAAGEEIRRRRSIATDRTWPFPLHSAESLSGLSAAVVSCFKDR